MTLKMTDPSMITATGTKHIALRTAEDMWAVTWLPGQEMNRNAAISAMTVAELAGLPLPNPAVEMTIDALAAEVGICCSDAIMLCLAEPKYGLHFVVNGTDGEGIRPGGSCHFAWFESEDERTRFARLPMVMSSRKLEG